MGTEVHGRQSHKVSLVAYYAKLRAGSHIYAAQVVCTASSLSLYNNCTGQETYMYLLLELIMPKLQ